MASVQDLVSAVLAGVLLTLFFFARNVTKHVQNSWKQRDLLITDQSMGALFGE